jgi:predicted 3-demethylubiquinone-9 3-methyltransferase (glyoxalase superfamily)
MKTLAFLAVLALVPAAIQAPKATSPSPKVTTFLMFAGQAEEAMEFYVSLLPGSKVLDVQRYGPGEQGAEGSVKVARFALAGQEYRCIDSAVQHDFTFTPAISLFVECETEAEIDALCSKLAEGGKTFMPLGSYGFSRKFAWVADRFGVAWQVNLD